MVLYWGHVRGGSGFESSHSAMIAAFRSVNHFTVSEQEQVPTQSAVDEGLTGPLWRRLRKSVIYAMYYCSSNSSGATVLSPSREIMPEYLQRRGSNKKDNFLDWGAPGRGFMSDELTEFLLWHLYPVWISGCQLLEITIWKTHFWWLRYKNVSCVLSEFHI